MMVKVYDKVELELMYLNLKEDGYPSSYPIWELEVIGIYERLRKYEEFSDEPIQYDIIVHNDGNRHKVIKVVIRTSSLIARFASSKRWKTFLDVDRFIKQEYMRVKSEFDRCCRRHIVMPPAMSFVEVNDIDFDEVYDNGIKHLII